MTSYWQKQPFDVLNECGEIKIIKQQLDNVNINLPDGFQFRILGSHHLQEIHSLIKNHYCTDSQNIYRIYYHKDFIYWYLKYIPPGFVVGLTYNNKLVGLITSTFVDMIVYDKKIKVPFINLFCVQNRIRKMGLGISLMDEMKKRLCDIKLTYALFSTPYSLAKPFCTTKQFAIPINHDRLHEVGFLQEKLTIIPKLESNPFHLLQAADIETVVTKLNNYLSKFSIRPYFTMDSAHHFFLPKKNITYSFVKRNGNNEVTDFVSVYQSYIYCFENQERITVANLSFYFYETMDLTELVMYLVDKLPSYGIDQLIFRNDMENNKIDLTKFEISENQNHYFYNVAIGETAVENFSFFPF